MVQSAAIKRATVPPHLRKKIYLVIDEADTFLKWDSLNVVLKETRKYGLHLILCTQNLVSGRGNEKLKHNLLNNTNVKIVWYNWAGTLSPLSKEIGVGLDELLSNRQHSFRLKIWPKKAFKYKTCDLLWKNSPLLIKPWKVRSINSMIAKKSMFYKPCIPPKTELEWIEDMPRDIREEILNQEAPKPRFRIESFENEKQQTADTWIIG